MSGCRSFAVQFVCVVYLIVLTKDIADTQKTRFAASEFSRHRLVHLTLHHARNKRELSTTRHSIGTHHTEVTITVTVDGKDYVLELKLNEDLVAADHVIRYQKNGSIILHKPTKEELDICQYSGGVRGRRGSWVAVSTCHGVRGMFYDGKNVLYIEPAEGDSISSGHYLFDHTDLTSAVSINNKNVSYKKLFDKQDGSRISRHKRSTNYNTEDRGPYDGNKLSRYVELVLVADYQVYQDHGRNIYKVHKEMKDIANIVNSIYAPLNIFIVLVGVVVWTEGDKIAIDEDGEVTLTRFLDYRMYKLEQIPNDNAVLVTTQKFLNGIVGKAYESQMCSYKHSGAITCNCSPVIGLVATTIAHEMGHNFGMKHDNAGTDCKCLKDSCIMSPILSHTPLTHWSSCSLVSLALSFEKGLDYCLRNKPQRLFGSPTCGNGFVEVGEQCDCGLQPSAACSACCDPRACLLRPNATCGAGQCCDPQTCRPKRAGTVCRAAERECDLPEYCSGRSEFCPDDVFKMDATPCANDQAYCVRGSCRTHTDQCRLIWGPTGQNSDSRCYNTYNVQGIIGGNCGYTRGASPVYTPCRVGDAMCGVLQCHHLKSPSAGVYVQTGPYNTSVLKYITNGDKVISCHFAMHDFGPSVVDPGFVPDGAKCGEDQMCLNRRCVSVASVKAGAILSRTSVCPSNCSGHGVCNSIGHCHCEQGFAPPLCDSPGSGGSVDSGPASDPSVQWRVMVAIYVIFLGILPVALLVLFLINYWRHKSFCWWKKPEKTYVSRFPNDAGSSSKSLKKSMWNLKSHFPTLFDTRFIKSLNRNDLTIKSNSPELSDFPVTNKGTCDNTANTKSHVNYEEKATCSNKMSHVVIETLKSESKVKNFNRKINKEDINVIVNCVESQQPKSRSNAITASSSSSFKTITDTVKADILHEASTNLKRDDPINKPVNKIQIQDNVVRLYKNIPQKKEICRNKEDIVDSKQQIRIDKFNDISKVTEIAVHVKKVNIEKHKDNKCLQTGNNHSNKSNIVITTGSYSNDGNHNSDIRANINKQNKGKEYNSQSKSNGNMDAVKTGLVSKTIENVNSVNKVISKTSDTNKVKNVAVKFEKSLKSATDVKVNRKLKETDKKCFKNV